MHQQLIKKTKDDDASTVDKKNSDYNVSSVRQSPQQLKSIKQSFKNVFLIIISKDGIKLAFDSNLLNKGC